MDELLDDLRARETALEESIRNLTDAIAAGGKLDALLSALQQREQERRRLIAERDRLDLSRSKQPLDVQQLRAALEQRVADWRTSASRSVAQGRQVLRKLLRGRVRMTPHDDGRVELSGQADYGKLFSGILLPQQQRVRPQRDSTRT